ncbi:hypothetical protein SAMN02982929_04160 [Saccharopolyspora kobensis]|uniref:Uncharacterized protein n=1 Tax=Saccharopolyspora kobensis TaxID=146035 RepID=A0A1H6DC32_9PSEU|nr:hypothetical protein [Saccharopolyspora kobensis]SEG82871.1 hypothetical protein SAMN02982929_04160 [Saccharopolyspora kobensis]SFE26817.1 hypothetical protein SAMN05216506_11077 [Saccharopolyspora kobensis]
MVHVAEGAGPEDRLHNLLLAMAGRVDDDGINSARELLGAGLPAAAAEYLTGCLIAGRIQVTTTEQHHLRRVLEETRSAHALADRLTAVDAVQLGEHRFGDPGRVDADLVAALAPVAGRLPGLRGLWCAARSTPAGVSYGAVPRRVLLAEVGADGSTAAIAYQLLEALRRSGINCSVEVFDSGAELPEYHREALAAAHRVHLDAAAAEQQAPERPAVEQRPVEQRPAVEQRPVAEQREAPAAAPAAPVAEPRSEQSERRHSVAPQREAEPQREEAPAEPALARSAEAVAEGQGMRVPAAVDAKLTDRERNLLRKLHEELAQREQDRSTPPPRRQNGANGEEGWTSTMPGGTGGFPPIGAAPANNQAYAPQQQRS